MVQAIYNKPYPNRLQLALGSVFGPLQSTVLGDFDPRRDLQVYNNGKIVTIDSFSFDSDYNRYLLYFKEPLDPTTPIQVIYHIPNPPFEAQVNNPINIVSSPGNAIDILSTP